MTTRTLNFDSPPASPVRSPILTPKKESNQNIYETATKALHSIPNTKTQEYSFSKHNKENIQPVPVNTAANQPSTPPKISRKACSQGKDDNRLAKREAEFARMRDTNPLKAVLTKAYALADGQKVVVAGKTYTKGQSLGKGNHCEAFATNVPGIVVKHLHREGILKLWASIPKYWAGVQSNTEQAATNGIPVAKIANVKTLRNDFVAVQPRYTFLDKIDPKHLAIGGPILNQVKQIFTACLKAGMVLEIKRENLAMDAQGFVCVGDVDQAMVEEDLKDGGQDMNIDRSLNTFTPKKAQFLDPRNNNPNGVSS